MVGVKEAKEYLSRVETADTKINTKLDDLARVRELALKVTQTLRQDSVSGGGSQDKIGDAVAKMMDLEAEIDRAVDEYIAFKKEVGAVIDQLEVANQIEVLYKHYFGKWDKATKRTYYLSLEEIAEEMHMSYRNVCYIHGDALMAVAEILRAGDT
jgi:hypothetical protein